MPALTIVDKFAPSGKKLRECREAKNLSQKELAAILNTSYSVIGKYERDEMIPSIEVAKNIARILNTTVGYLLGETEEVNLFKDPAMLNRFNEIEKLDGENKKHIISVVDAFIQALKFKNIAAL